MRKKMKIYSKEQFLKQIRKIGGSCTLVLTLHEDEDDDGIDVRIGEVDDNLWNEGEKHDLIDFYSDFIIQAMGETPGFKRIMDRVKEKIERFGLFKAR